MAIFKDKHTILYMVTALAVTMLFSCTDDFKEIQNLSKSTFAPLTKAENINLKYTDSGKVKAILVSPEMLDYSNVKYAFMEFPKGVHLTVFDSENNKNFVVSKYAISHTSTKMIELLDSVVITTHDGKKLLTDQLFYDEKQDWFYTDKHFTFIDNFGSFIQGPGIDFSRDFKVFNTQRNSGEYKNNNEEI